MKFGSISIRKKSQDSTDFFGWQNFAFGIILGVLRAEVNLINSDESRHRKQCIRIGLVHEWRKPDIVWRKLQNYHNNANISPLRKSVMTLVVVYKMTKTVRVNCRRSI